MTHQVSEVCASGKYIKQTFTYAEQPGYLYTQLKETFPWIHEK